MKSLLLMSVLLCSAAWVQAQQDPQTNSPSSSTQGDTTKAQPIEGCLQGTGGTFTLTDTAGNKYLLQGDTSKLSEHVGHEVQITGTVVKTSSSTSTESPGSSTNSASQQSAIEVQDVKHMADTCSSTSK